MHMIQRLGLEELYNSVWREPVSALAPRFGISESKLKKACASALIPLPGRIYWAKRRAGKVIVQIDLPRRVIEGSRGLLLDRLLHSEVPIVMAQVQQDFRSNGRSYEPRVHAQSHREL